MTDHGAIGHNSVAGDRLRGFIERIERLEEEKREVADQVKEVLAEAKANGFDTKTVRRIVRERRKSVETRQEEEALFSTYLHALGMAVFD